MCVGVITYYISMCRVAKFDPQVGSRRTTKIKKSGRPRHYFGCPHFVTLLYVCGTSSHTAVFVDKGKICWDEYLWVNSFPPKKMVVRRTTSPQFLVVLTYLLVVEDARTLEFCYPDVHF